jgi:hypothetical protein
MNQYELAIDTLNFYFDEPIKEAVKHLPEPSLLANILREKGADNPEERAQAVDFYFGSKTVLVKKYAKEETD